MLPLTSTEMWANANANAKFFAQELSTAPEYFNLPHCGQKGGSVVNLLCHIVAATVAFDEAEPWGCKQKEKRIKKKQT